MNRSIKPRSWRVLAAFLAMAAIVTVAEISLAPNHGHGAARCEICQTAHLPYVQTPLTAVVNSGVPVPWDGSPESTAVVLDPSLIQSHSRAPPA